MGATLQISVEEYLRTSFPDGDRDYLNVAIYADHEPADEAPSEPPLIAIEIVSREDRYTDLLEKLEEYRQWGAAQVWLLDPWLRKASVYRSGSPQEADVLALPEQGVEIQPAALFG